MSSSTPSSHQSFLNMPSAKVLPQDSSCDLVVEMMREMSLQSDPQEMVSLFRQRARLLYGGDGSMSLSRRGLEFPNFRMTRNTQWKENINPWKHPNRLPVFSGGLLAELIYSDKPMVFTSVCVPKDDPVYEMLKEAQSLMVLPLFDQGVALNMVVRFAKDPQAFDQVNLADALLTANVFGRATNSLVVAQRLEVAYAQLDREMKHVAEIQKSLLPQRLPHIFGLDLATSYVTADRAGGDYYDFFDLEDGRWGLLIADVSGHGTPAAVVMAMLRTMLHARCIECVTPAELLTSINRQLFNHSNRYDGTFVTAFYGVYNPDDGSLHYTCAGHNPPLVVEYNSQLRQLDDAQAMPLAVDYDTIFQESVTRLSVGDTLLMYTDGITEATDQQGDMYGLERLLGCVCQDVSNAQHIIDCITLKLQAFSGTIAPLDDQTLVALRVNALR